MKKCIYFILSTLFILACNSDQKKGLWYEKTKAKIIIESDKMFDSIATGAWKGTSLLARNYFLNGQQFKTEVYRDTAAHVVAKNYHYDKFEFRSEYCINGNLSFEGIVYDGKFYGLSTWWHCNGKMQKQGIRFESENIGTWKIWDTSGKLIETKNYGREDLIDSLELIK